MSFPRFGLFCLAFAGCSGLSVSFGLAAVSAERYIHVMSFDEGMSSNRYALGEVFDFAQKVKATVVEPCFSNGRMGSCKDIDNITVRGALLGEVYELKKLRRIAPVMPYAEFVNISQRFKLGETKVVCLHAGTGGSHCVGMENRCKKDLGTFGFVPGVKVLEIHSYRKSCLKGYRTPPEFLVKDLHFLDKTLDFVDNTLMPLLKLQTGQFHAYHWRSELMKKHGFLYDWSVQRPTPMTYIFPHVPGVAQFKLRMAPIFLH